MEIDNVVKNRKTEKVLAKQPWSITMEEPEVRVLVSELLDLAAYAPYHYKCHARYSEDSAELNSCLPFRFYVIDSTNCRMLSKFIEENDIPAGKIANMLNAADVLFIVTWLPEPSTGEVDLPNGEAQAVSFDGNKKNMEHIAAGSAAIQNVLIGATARNIPSYWSSGGALRSKELKEPLGISLDEILLGAIFLFPKDIHERDAMVRPGALRDQGKEKDAWSKWIDLNNAN